MQSDPYPTHFSSHASNDEEEDVMGRNTIKLRAQAVLNQNHGRSQQPNQYGVPAPMGCPPSEMRQGRHADCGRAAAASSRQQNVQVLKWELTPDLMNQPWGSVLRALK